MRRDAEKAKDFAKRHQVPKYYTDADKLIADDEVNAIYIATPPAFHEEYAMQAMKAGKPVYIEKPVTLNSASCERLLKASQQLGVKASVAHYRRGLPLFGTISSAIRRDWPADAGTQQDVAGAGPDDSNTRLLENQPGGFRRRIIF